MRQSYDFLKVILVAASILIISFLHYGAIGSHLGLHIIHRELFFIPIILACFWFGSVLGVATSVLVCIIYFPHIYLFKDSHGTLSAVLTQSAVFITVALSIGYLIDRQRRKQAELTALENLEVLGRAALVVEYEITSTLKVLRSAFKSNSAPRMESEMEDYRREIDRLAQMAEALRSFVPRQDHIPTVHDLNITVQQRVETLQPLVKQHHLYMRVELDPNGCPSKTHPERFGPILGDLIKNAIEASSAGQTIRIITRRGGDFCKVTVEDDGEGISSEHLPKIFSPFFTTKPNGQGLALAASRKYIRGIGGDMRVESVIGKGSKFTLSLPREETEAIIGKISKQL